MTSGSTCSRGRELGDLPRSYSGQRRELDYDPQSRFSDAADLFVFISGYTASFVYARMMLDRGFIVGATRLTKRVWQLYVAHIILFVIYIAAISYLALRLACRDHQRSMSQVSSTTRPRRCGRDCY